MKVLFPIHIDRWPRSISNTLRATAVRNPDIDFYSFSGPLTDEDHRLGAEFWAHDNVHKMSYADLFRVRFDVVHHRTATGRNLTAVALAKARSPGRCRHVFTISIEVDRLERGERLHPIPIRRADALTAVSRIAADSARRTYGRDVDAVVYNGVDTAFFRPDLAATGRLDALGITQPFALTIGQVILRKRPDFVVALARTYPAVRFVMAGPLLLKRGRAEFLEAVRSLPNLTYLDVVSQETLRDLYGAAAAFVFPSEREGFGQVLTEASAMGVPILARNATTTPEVVLEGRTGWLFDTDDPREWGPKLEEVLSWNGAAREAFASRARSFVAERFSLDATAAGYRAVYESVVGR